jgi:hypothetical protein
MIFYIGYCITDQVEHSHYNHETKSKKYYLLVCIYWQIVNITRPEHQFYCMHGGIEPAPDTFITLLQREVFIVLNSPIIFFVQGINVFSGLYT